MREIRLRMRARRGLVFMAKRGTGEVAGKLLGALTGKMGEKPTVQDIALAAGVNWETTRKYLGMFCRLGIVLEMKGDDGKIYYEKVGAGERGTLFGIPLSSEQKVTILRIYSTIQKVWAETPGIAISKTRLQKVAVEVVEARYGGIPRGWYLYGELLPLALYSDAAPILEAEEDVAAVRKALAEYSGCESTREIMAHQYKLKGKRLYIAKERLDGLLLNLADRESRMEIYRFLNEFAACVEKGESNERTKAIVEEFAGSALSIFRNCDDKRIEEAQMALLDSFGSVWGLVAACEYYESMMEFYDTEILDYYMCGFISDKERLALESLESLDGFVPAAAIPDNEQMRKLKALQGKGKALTQVERKEN